VAELAATRKCDKYADIPGAYSFFLPIAIDTHGFMNAADYDFFHEVGRRISKVTGDDREVAFIFQRLSVLIQRFNSALLSQSFAMHDARRLGPLTIPGFYFAFTFCFLTPGIFTIRGITYNICCLGEFARYKCLY